MGAHGKRQRLPFRRRRDGATDYRRRMRLLRSGAPRAVVRISNTRTLCQLVTYDADGDQVLMTVTGSDLVATYGWSESHSRKSVPASYLVGYALGKAATVKRGTRKRSWTSDSPGPAQGAESSRPSRAWWTQDWRSPTASTSSLNRRASRASTSLSTSPMTSSRSRTRLRGHSDVGGTDHGRHE